MRCRIVSSIVTTALQGCFGQSIDEALQLLTCTCNLLPSGGDCGFTAGLTSHSVILEWISTALGFGWTVAATVSPL